MAEVKRKVRFLSCIKMRDYDQGKTNKSPSCFECEYKLTILGDSNLCKIQEEK